MHRCDIYSNKAYAVTFIVYNNISLYFNMYLGIYRLCHTHSQTTYSKPERRREVTNTIFSSMIPADPKTYT